MTTLVKNNSKNNTTKESLINDLVNKNLSKSKTAELKCVTPICGGF